jgi:acyl-CoA thioesterase FadM
MTAESVGTFVVDQLGIKDIDGYGHVWYGNYLKFFERGVQAFLGGGSVICVEHLKYKRSVPWGAADSRIESYLVSRPAPGRALVYQRWCVGHEDDCTNALCLSEVALPPGVGDSVPITAGGDRLLQGRGSAREPKLAMAVKNLQTGGVPPVSAEEPILGRMLIPRHCFADMVAGGTRGMLLVDAMDLFEQSRSEVVGGQPGLKAFMDRGLALVVGQVDGLVLAQGVQVDPASTLGCEVTLIRETTERRCFHFLQRLLRPDGTEVARVRVLMCCVDPAKGDLVRVPDDSWADWTQRMARLA